MNIPEDWNLSEMTQKDERSFEVLGLLGPAGSGKDLVADWLMERHDFIKVPFADPIKRFASKCFGLSNEALWGPSEKRNEMFAVDQQWWFEAIGHMGEAAEEITQHVLEVGVRVSGYLAMHDWLTNLRREYPEKISARLILQTLGTEWGREVDDLLWAKYAHKIANRLRTEKGLMYSQEDGIFGPKMSTAGQFMYKGVVIPDHRFINELKLTQELGGHVLRLRRLSQEQAESVGIAGHRSEAEQKTIPDEAFSHVFNFEEGIEKVYQALEDAFTVKAWLKKAQVYPS